MKQHESSIEEILASNKLLSIEGEEEINMYAQYLMYKLERDYYDLCKEDDECNLADLEWDIFIEAFYSCAPIRDAAEVVLRKTILDFPGRDGYFDFKATDIRFLDASDEELATGDTIHAAKIFPLEKVAALLQWMLFQCEICFYQYQLNAGKDYSWTQYIDELAADRKMWDTVIDAFRDALTRLDFKPAWELDNLEELVQQHKNATLSLEDNETLVQRINTILGRFEAETDIDKVTAFRAVWDYMKKQDKDKLSLERMAACLESLLEKKLNGENAE